MNALLPRVLLAAAAAGAIGAALYFALRTDVAPIPPPFSASRSVQDARAAAAATGRPILVLAVAEWCPYCQQSKREVFTDPRVAELVRTSVEPLYLDLSSKQTDPAVAELAAELWITEVPTLALLENDRSLGRLVGFNDAQTVADWLASRGQKAPAKPGKRGVLPR